MSSEPLIQPSEALSGSQSSRQWIFEELPKATIISVSRPETGDISPILLSYTIELQYKQFKWRLLKKASQVLYLQFALRKRALIEDLYEVKEWLQSLGIADQTVMVQDDEEPDDGAVPLHQEDSVKSRYVPSIAALSIIRPSLGGQQSVADRAKVSMQGYLNHFLGNLDIVNSQEVCRFLEVSKLSFLQEYGPKLKEGYVTVKHLSNISQDSDVTCLPCDWFRWCDNKWEKVWAVLKPGFLALLDDPFNNKPLDIIVFDVLPSSNGDEGIKLHLADPIKERNPLCYTFKVTTGSRSIWLRTTSSAKVKSWVTAINETGLRPMEGWCCPHRFGSFAPERGLTEDGSQAQWFVDGQAAFEAIASSIQDAKSEIFITGWWLCPELYLKRPFDSFPTFRLESLLEEKAKQGVQIYVLLYKEVSLALKINSLYSMRRLLKIHENVRVLRYPDHFASRVYYWSHHEKLVIVDYKICYIGGLDLCFGRYDTPEHKVGDCPSVIWPGKDYYNPRESEPNSWEDTMRDELDRKKHPRMPWHDVQCALWGPPCRDIARHFVQRWNHAKRTKAPNELAIPLLMPHHHMVIPHYLGRRKEIDIDGKKDEDKNKEIDMQDSFSSQSPMQDIPLLLPQEAVGLVTSKGDDTNFSGSSPLLSQKLEHETLVSDTQMKGFEDEVVPFDLGAQPVVDDLEDWGETPEGTNEYGQVGPCTTCHCQVLRSVDHWSAGTGQTEKSIHTAYCSLIEKAEHFIYIENQFFISGLEGDDVIQNRILEALYRRILLAHKEQKNFRVIIVMPLLPGFQGGLDDGGAATVRALTHWQYRTISREKHSILQNLEAILGHKTHDYISFYGLRSHGRLHDEGPMATSQVYVHSKLMIIDDRVALIGSSNINDRSLLGFRDSEIGVLIEDKEHIESLMNGKPWNAGKFSYSLRCSLWSEHLGLHTGEISKIRDPVANTTYKDLWSATAKENTRIYHEVFACIPNDQIHSRCGFIPSILSNYNALILLYFPTICRAALRQSMAQWKERLGHTTIDLGIAPNKIFCHENGEIKVIDPIERLKSVKGHLVSFPLEFMREEDLRPVAIESEFYVAPHVYH
ncbi:phospholipase D zeta 1-like isoform X2 [Gastrolobium bilobum]|uniref:phospholipase D zeta 1-like isoform X2 n=1 Tax=Gastrolobium bilobum TaxID=150636 RepID=UPI002AB02823|nr:phospholipase D zeta 1-like isoform X2 [Gastrolobium bilobum]